MDPISKHQGAFARAWAALLAIALMFQVAIAATPAAAIGVGQGGAICAAQPLAPDRQPLDSHRGHRHGLCCILHCAALDAPPSAPRPVVFLSFPATDVQPPSPLSAPAPRVEPKGAPQSPRAPPAAA